MSLAIKSQGTLFEIEALPIGSGSWTAIAEVQSIPASGGQAPEIDVTHLRSTGKEYLLGLPDYGSVQIAGNYLGVGVDAGQTMVRARYLDQAPCQFRMTLSDTGTTQQTFTALVQSFDIAVTPDSKVDLSFTLRRTGADVIA